MGRGKELVKNTAIVAIGKVCTKFWVFILLPFYTSVLSTEEYGIVDLINTYVSLLLPIVGFQMADAVFRFSIDIRKNENEKRKMVSTVICFLITQCVLFAIIFLMLREIISIQYKEFLLLNVVVSVLSGALFQLLRGLGDNLGYSIGSFLTAFTAIILNILLVLALDYGVKGMFIATFCSNIVAIIYIVCKAKVFKFFEIKGFEYQLLKKMLAYSLPLIPNYVCWWIVGASDKSVVNYFLGTGAVGILSVAQKFSTAYTTVYSIFNLTWTENASMHRNDVDRSQYYSQIIEIAFRLLASASLGFIATMALAFPYLVNEKFDAAYYQIPIYMLSALVHSVIGIYSVVYIAFKKTKRIAKSSMLAAVVNLGVNIVLIQYIGLYAASVSSVLAYVALFGVRYFDIQKIVKIRIKKQVVCSVIAMMIICFITFYLRNTWISIFNFVIVVIYVFYLNRKLLFEAANMLKNR